MINAEQIVEAIQDMITTHSQEANAHLMRIGAIALESENIGEHSRYYYESRARVFILNDLLEKIAKTPEDTTRSKAAKLTGNLDTYDIQGGHAEAWYAKDGIEIEHYPDAQRVYLDAKQALSLLAYLEQEKPTLERLAEASP